MLNMIGDAYILGDLLGCGGMGSVYAAEQRSLGRAVAIKLIHPQLANLPAIVERFRIEALAGSRLRHPHPHVAGVVDFGTTRNGVPFLVMERVSGEPLEKIIERHGALPLRRACDLGLQILTGLGQVHAAGVVHADVKSGNILVETGEDGDVATLIDFGIATVLDQPKAHRVDEDGQTILSGTPEYMAPEVIRGQPPTPLSDLYSVGIILYELITGVTPFAGTTLEVLRSQVDDEVIPPMLRCPDRAISVALDHVVMRAVSKDPMSRFASAACFARALREVMFDQEVLPMPNASTVSGSFSSETSTQEWRIAPPLLETSPHANRTIPHSRDRGDELRIAIGDAIVRGCVEDIATRYLALARYLVDQHRLEDGVRELDQAIDILTLGEGPDTAFPRPVLWRVLLAQASLLAGTGNSVGARRMAHAANAAADRVSSAAGCDRARVLLRRLICGAKMSSIVSSKPVSIG